MLGFFLQFLLAAFLKLFNRILANNDMNLYRHLVSCPTALQLFLNYYSHYWCLIPMSNVDADRDDRNYGIQHSESMVSLENSPEETIQSGDESINEIRDHDTIVWCQDHLPSPPISYRFSKRQRAEQYSFFQTKLDGCPLSRQFDIYNASIVIARMKSFCFLNIQNFALSSTRRFFMRIVTFCASFIGNTCRNQIK